ncbi:SWI/SNF complex subunit SWI3A [Sorghum bicolor]|uniref:SWI/SNF complex subunit SWI3A n=1 Tax=Sorghum bicolor TaxID=4558 RepID=UPI000B4254C5|nr:SWI/SNF complex subunit SWI3A [Sorghum bicolor]|eukprot:XP_021318974.1 SWI/SNF complex subunit SWI3A [Sorghum bicolor]
MSPPVAGAAATSGDGSPRELYTIPASSGWFRWDGIHETERQALPEFFGGAGGAGFGTATRNPRIYREYRDFIIAKYREDPARRLTFTEVRRALVGDVTLLRKLFAFLDSSGLINFSASSSSSGPASRKQEVGVVVEAPVGLQVTPRPPASYFAEEKRGAVGGEKENGFRLPPLTSYSDVFGEWAPGKAPICGFCGEECNGAKVETLQDGFKVCSKCSKSNNDNNKEEANKCPGDKKESMEKSSGAWTDAETLLLLEGVLKHGDDWDLIAQHVRTKNKSECIARLIQLPFGEHMLGTINGKSASRLHINQATDGKTNQHIMKEPSSHTTEMADGMQIDGNEDSADKSVEEYPTKRRRLFSSMDATTSLMEQLALLTTTASPDVVAAAADAAIKAFSNENPQAKKAFRLSEREYKTKAFGSNHVQQIDRKIGDKDVKMHGQPGSDKQEKKFIANAYQLRAAVATAVGVAAARAKMLADQEEREMELLMASVIETQTGHELPEREKEAYARSRACRLALIDHAVARKKPPLNAFKPHPEHKSKLVCKITGDTVNKLEDHIWKHINGKRFLNKLEKLEDQVASGEMADEEPVKSNEVAKKSKSRKKDKKKANVASPSLPREPKPEMDDSDDPDFWVPPVGSRWDDDDGKDRWESSPGKPNSAKNKGGSDDDGAGDNDGGGDDDTADKDDAESRELASRTKRMSIEAVGPSSFASRKKKPKKEQ